MLGSSSSITGVVTISAILLIFHLAKTLLPDIGITQPVIYVYGGLIFELVLTQIASAYATVQTIDAISKSSGTFYYLTRGHSVAGDLIGLYELFAALGYLTWSLVISIVGFIMSGLLWQHYEIREKGAVTEGFLGLPFATTSMYKYLTLGLIVGGGAWISAMTLGDSANKLLGFFDNYDPT